MIRPSNNSALCIESMLMKLNMLKCSGISVGNGLLSNYSSDTFFSVVAEDFWCRYYQFKNTKKLSLFS